jgi:hypothetical protein
MISISINEQHQQQHQQSMIGISINDQHQYQ